MLLQVADILTNERPEVDWIIPNFVSAGSLIALAGEPGAGKSFFTYTVSMALATGTSVLGWSMEPRRVLYFDQENSLPDSEEYWKWAWIGLGRPDQALIRSNLVVAAFELGDVGWVKRAADLAHATQPALIVIDTTTPACNIQDENDNAEATRVITQIRRIQQLVSPTASVIALKHAKLRKDEGGYTLRGAKAWEGAVDAVVYLLNMQGRPEKALKEAGLRATILEPAKVRAFGLREGFQIRPEWVEGRRGLRLRRAALPVK